MQPKILAPYWGFFSAGHFAGHERKFGQDFKDIFLELYREFESRLARQRFRTSTFSMGGKAAIPSIELGHFKNQTVLESAELGDLFPGDGIFLQSFVLRQFGIV